MSDTDPHVAIVVLNWNAYETSSRCLESLSDQTYPNLSIVLVDNGSTDGSAERLHDEFSSVKVIQNEDNRGFSGGMNVGIQAAMENRANYIWILNNDVVVPDNDIVARLIETMKTNQRLGVVTPKIMRYPETREEWFTQGLVNWSSGNSRHEPEVVDNSKRDGDLVLNDFVPFCAALFRREIFEEVGLFPEPYFVYREDIEFCGRITAKEYAIATNLRVNVYHEESNSSGGDLGPTITYYTARNRWLLYRRMAQRTDTLMFSIDYLKWSLKKLGAILRAGRSGSVVAWARGTLDGIRGRSGKGPYP